MIKKGNEAVEVLSLVTRGQMKNIKRSHAKMHFTQLYFPVPNQMKQIGIVSLMNIGSN